MFSLTILTLLLGMIRRVIVNAASIMRVFSPLYAQGSSRKTSSLGSDNKMFGVVKSVVQYKAIREGEMSSKQLEKC